MTHGTATDGPCRQAGAPPPRRTADHQRKTPPFPSKRRTKSARAPSPPLPAPSAPRTARQRNKLPRSRESLRAGAVAGAGSARLGRARATRGTTWAPVRLACAARHCHAAAARLPFPFWSGFGGPCSPGAHCAGWRRPLLWVARGAALLRRHSGVPHTCTQSPPPVALGQRFWAPRRAPRENVRLEGVGMVCREPPVAPRGGRAAPRKRGGGAAAAGLPTGA